MEIIRKKISLYDSMSHVNGGIPYISYNEPFDDNWKTYEESEDGIISSTFNGFASDISENESIYNDIMNIEGISSGISTEAYKLDDNNSVIKYNIIRTCTLFNWYNQLLDMLRKGIHLKHSKDEMCTDEINYSKTYYENFNYTGTTYDFLRDNNVTVYDGTIDDFYTIDDGIYESDIDIQTDYVIVIDEYDKFIELGGRDLIEIVDNLINQKVNLTEKVTPYIPIHILLTNDVDDLGVMTPYGDESYDEESLSYDTKYMENVNDWVIKPFSSDTEGIQVESKLQTLKCKKYLVTDNGEIINGCLRDEDKRALVNRTIYRRIPLELPFIKNEVINKDTSNAIYTGDYVSDMIHNGQEHLITFVYYIGRVFPNSDFNVSESSGGIRYEETYRFEVKHIEIDSLYGMTNVGCDYIDVKYDEAEVTVYNEDFNIYRNANISSIKEMTLGDVWRNFQAINTPLFKEEYLMSANIDSNIKLNVEIDRGNAAAFEKHLILNECNTYDDLKNYRNNLFNL